MTLLNRGALVQELKIHPVYFRETLGGTKTAEIRYDDRDYRIGDTLRLKEWLPRKKEFTGRYTERVIVGITRLGWVIPGVSAEWCVLHLKPKP